ncbi:MAG TPA: nuclear transport factor 2 family protein [Myxococcota bacterium]|nr:nuclear transport factor 2 family protein [Myxococcota bacterium]
MTEQERRNLEAVKRWEETYNLDVEKMVDEVYAPSCEVVDMLRGVTLRGREELRAIERRMVELAPQRRLRVLKAVASGDTVALECEGIFPGATFPACVFLVFDARGQVISDHSYAGDPTGKADQIHAESAR